MLALRLTVCTNTKQKKPMSEDLIKKISEDLIYCKDCKHIGTQSRHYTLSTVVCYANPLRTPSFHKLETEHYICSVKNENNDCTDYEKGWSFGDKMQAGVISFFVIVVGLITLL